MIVIVPCLLLILGLLLFRRARHRRRLAKAKVDRLAGIERVLRKLVVLMFDGRKNFIEISCLPERTKGCTLIHLSPNTGGHALLKRFMGTGGANYVIHIEGIEGVSTLFPPDGVTCDESWFRRRMEQLFERFGPSNQDEESGGRNGFSPAHDHSRSP